MRTIEFGFKSYGFFILACWSTLVCRAQDFTCKDRYPNYICDEYFRRGLCQFVQEKCKKTCFLCDQTPTSTVEPTWGQWGNFGDCSVTCGYGVQYRSRDCSAEHLCPGRASSARLCFEGTCHPETWNPWGPFTSCSVTCGRGVQSRKRTCSAPSRCFGVNVAVKPCEVVSCSNWGEWSDYGACSVSCGSGIQVRYRSCKGGNACEGSRTSIRTCSSDNCVLGRWTAWGPFSGCSASCGRGTRTRYRTCRGAKKCHGSNESAWPCRKPPCMLDDGWSNCTRSCGVGSRYRFDYAQCTDVRNPRCLRSFQECNTGPCAPEICRMNQIRRYKEKSCCTVSKDTSCGFSFVASRIISGAVSKNRQWPWMVSISVRGVLCGATLISRYWVITAAHCIKKDQKMATTEHIRVKIGSNYLYDTALANEHQVQKIVLYPLYKDLKNDIALLKLKRKVVFGPDVQPICLPHGETPAVDSKCFALGWGMTEPNTVQSVPSSLLMEVELKNLDINVCRRAYGSNTNIGDYVRNSDRLLCAGSLTQRNDICRGDSGGPLLCQRRSSCAWYLAGVISFGPKGTCGEIGYPGMFTKVSSYEKWIFRHVPHLRNQPAC